MNRSSSVTCCSRIGPATRIAPTDYGPGASLCGGRAFRGRHWSGLPATNSLVKRLSGWGEERVDERVEESCLRSCSCGCDSGGGRCFEVRDATLSLWGYSSYSQRHLAAETRSCILVQ